MESKDESKRFITELVRKHYPEKYVELYGVDAGVASELTHKRLKEEAKKQKIHHFNSMTFMELSKAIEAKRMGNEDQLKQITETASQRFQEGAMKTLKKAGKAKDEISKQAERVAAARAKVESAGKKNGSAKPKAEASAKEKPAAVAGEVRQSLQAIKDAANKLGIPHINSMNKTMLLKAIEAKEGKDEKALEAIVSMAKAGKRL